MKMENLKNQQNKKKFESNSFEFTPFNFCDRWCERCNQCDKCRIFQDMFANRVEHIARGEDPDSPTVVFADMKKTFALMTETVRKDLQKQGVDLEKIKIAIIEERDINQWLGSEISSLWFMGHRFMLETRCLLASIFSEQDDDELLESIESIRKKIEELDWYHAFFDIKLHRALVGQRFLKREKNPTFRSIGERDMNVSAKLAYQALASCQGALCQISRYCCGYMSWAGNLSILARLIAEKIEAQFPELNKVKVIFHG